MAITFSIQVEIYDCRLHVLSGASDEDFELYIFQHFRQLIERTTSQGTCWTIFDDKGKEHYLIDLHGKMKKDGECINLIVHEALHVTFAIADRIKMPYSIDFDEPFCYLHGWLVQKIFEGVF